MSLLAAQHREGRERPSAPEEGGRKDDWRRGRAPFGKIIGLKEEAGRN